MKFSEILHSGQLQLIGLFTTTVKIQTVYLITLPVEYLALNLLAHWQCRASLLERWAKPIYSVKAFLSFPVLSVFIKCSLLGIALQ